MTRPVHTLFPASSVGVHLFGHGSAELKPRKAVRCRRVHASASLHSCVACSLIIHRTGGHGRRHQHHEAAHGPEYKAFNLASAMHNLRSTNSDPPTTAAPLIGLTRRSSCWTWRSNSARISQRPTCLAR